MENVQKENYPRCMKIGEKQGFSCVTSHDGTSYVGSYDGDMWHDDIEIGITMQVWADGKRKKIPTYNPNVVLSEIRVGDSLAVFNRFEEDQLYVRIYEICDIHNDVAIGVGMSDQIYYGERVVE